MHLAVFDCDGTLVDSQSSIIFAMQAACDHHGFAHPTDDQIRRVVGLPLEVAIGRVLPDVGPALAQDICETYKNAFGDLRQSGALEEPLFSGVFEVLKSLDAKNWLLGVATGKSHRGMKRTLDHHGLMDMFVTHQNADTAHGKPHPDMMLKALSETGAEPAFSVMIGDTTFDVEMAKNAGVRVIGVDWGYHDADELMDAGAFKVVKTSEELLSSLLIMMEPPR
ncbi:MAG: HAD-IA family hydrolase [Magnetovibrio sp.]|nr:HAD-IA family hydrolase [Magnetovibrio sp.]